MIEESQELIGTISTEGDLHGQISPPNGTDDYTYLKNKPQINNVSLNGNISLDDIGAVSKETGKGLSSNDFTNTYKDDVDSNTENRHTHTNKSILDNITANDISFWNNKSDFSGDYDDLDNKPTIPNITQQQILNIDKNTDMLNGIKPINNIFIGSIQSKNLLNITVNTTTINGVTVRLNNDKSITLNGTANADTSISISNKIITEAGDYVFGITTDFSNIGHGFEVGGYVYNSSDVYQRNLSTNRPNITLQNGEYIKSWNIYFQSGAVFNYFTIYPQLEKGNVATDYVEHKNFGMESGSNSDGSWIKYADGTMICWRNNYTGELTPSIAWGGFYVGKITDEIPFAQSFIDTPTVYYDVIPTSATGFFQVNYDPPTISSSSITNICIARPSSTKCYYRIQLIAIGRWK